jgi:MFS family permease
MDFLIRQTHQFFRRLNRLPRPLFYLYAGTIVTRMGTFVFPYLTIYLSEQRDINLDDVGWILSVGSIGLLLGNFVGGWLTDKWSRKNTLISALLLNAIGFGCLAFDYAGLWQYMVLLFVGYFGSGLYNPAANTLIADYTDDAIRPFAYTVQYICVNIGMALGPLLGGFLAEISYDLIFIGDVLTSLLCAILIFFCIADTRQSVLDSTPDKDVHSAISKRLNSKAGLVISFSLIYFFLICPLMGLEFAVPLLVKKEFSSKLVYVGYIYTINAGCVLFFSLLVEKLFRYRNECLIMICAGVFWTSGLLILVFGYSITALVLCTFVWTVGEIIASIVVPTFIARRVSAGAKGRYLSLVDVVRSLAGVLCPIGLGTLWNYSGAFPVVLVITSLPMIAVVGYILIYLLGGPSARAIPKFEMESKS